MMFLHPYSVLQQDAQARRQVPDQMQVQLWIQKPVVVVESDIWGRIEYCPAGVVAVGRARARTHDYGVDFRMKIGLAFSS